MFLLLVFILFVTIALFYLTQKKYTKATLFLILMGLSYLIVFAVIITYLSKDAYYYNSLNKYFGISKQMQNQLMFLPVSRYLLIRILNMVTMTFLYSGLCAAIFFTFNLASGAGRRILIYAAIPLAIQIVVYDPSFYSFLYYRLYPDVISSQGFNAVYHAVHIVTLCINMLYILAGIVLFVYALFDAPKVRIIRSNILMVLIGYFSIQITYVYVNFWAPDILVTVSKAMNFTRFKPIELPGSPLMYTLLPYISAFCLAVSLYSIYMYARFQNRIRNMEFVISRNIDSAVLTSRVFSHYIKNELLGIIAQTEFLEEMCEKDKAVVDEIDIIKVRCQRIYDRLDAVRHKSLKSKFNLKPVSLYKLLQELFDEKQMKLKGIQVTFDPGRQHPYIMADSYYFAQAIENLLDNAVEALETVPEKSRKIDIQVNIKNKWVELIIRDNGVGIGKEDLEQIFQPFYSSKPTSKNWGMGLSLSHSIITSHEGKISAESQSREGSAFHVIMPIIVITDGKGGLLS